MITYLSTEDVPLRSLDPFPGNARRGDVDGIAASIQVNGQYRSLIVRKTPAGSLIVLAGNHTADALRLIGREEARCELIECDDETATRVNLVDNRLPDTGGYDDAALSDLLKSLDGFAGTGYAPDDLDDLLSRLGDVPEMEPGPSGARYAESEEEAAQRRERVDNYEPRQTPSGGTAVELIVVMPVGDHQEATALIRSVRDRDGQDLTAGQIVLYALRNHAGVVADENEENDD
jgi:ParB-like chromosome segregation protein Spo0J